jgi:two-component system, LytTR family, response regulator
MKTIRTIIVDDEPLARRGLRRLLNAHDDIEIVAECANGRQAIETINELEPELLLLDIQMPEVDGFKVIAEVGTDRIPAVIFITAFDRHAVRAFEIQALDYLVKPVDGERFNKALVRARKHIAAREKSDLGARLQGLLSSITPQTRYPVRLAVKSRERIKLVEAGEIDWIEAADNYVCLHVGAETHLLREKMSALESRLDPAQFLRVHRSTIVNVGRIKELRPLFRGAYEIVLRDGTRVSSARKYHNKLLGLLGKSA